MLRRFIVIKGPRKVYRGECRTIIMPIYEKTKARALARALKDKAMQPDWRYLTLRAILEVTRTAYPV